MRTSSKGKAPRKVLPKSLGPVLTVTAGEDQGRQLPLIYARTVLGRKYGDILFRDNKISGTHAAIEYKVGTFRLFDLGSSNGSFIDNKKIKESVLQPGQTVRVGLTAFQIDLNPSLYEELLAKRPVETAQRGDGGLTELIAKEFVEGGSSNQDDATQSIVEPTTENVLEFIVHLGPMKGKRFTSSNEKILLGRSDVDFVLRDPDVSRKHALIEKQSNGQVILRDLASRNGTFVNERKITNCVLSRGDQIRLGQTTLIFKGGS